MQEEPREGQKRPTHAGVVAFRFSDSEPRYLLITASARPDEWVLPKGHIEQGETADEAALREVSEEAGIDGTLVGHLCTQEFDAVGESVRVAWQLLEVQDERPSPEGRHKRWGTLPEVLASASFDNQREVIVRADARVG